MKYPFRLLLNCLLAAVLAGALYEWQTISRLRAENERLRADVQTARESGEAKRATALAPLHDEIKRLTDETSEIHKLRNEVGQLRRGSNELARVRLENLQLREALKTVATAPAPGTTTASPAGELYFPKENWTFAGYATPEAALQSAVWAMSQGDFKTVLASVTPEKRASLEKKFENKTPEQIKAEGKREMEKVTGFRILDRKVLSDSEVMLHVFPEGENHAQKMLMRKIGAEWKMAGPYSENN